MTSRRKYLIEGLRLLKSQIPVYWTATCERCVALVRTEDVPEDPFYCERCKAERKRIA